VKGPEIVPGCASLIDTPLTRSAAEVGGVQTRRLWLYRTKDKGPSSNLLADSDRRLSGLPERSILINYAKAAPKAISCCIRQIHSATFTGSLRDVYFREMLSAIIDASFRQVTVSRSDFKEK
jgi:hypothetical protein